MDNIVSHITIPRLLLKNFLVNGSLYYFDLNELSIKKGNANIGAELGYYQKVLDNALGSRIESPFGQVISKLKRIKNKPVTLTQSEIDVIKNFYKACIFRQPHLHKVFAENSVFLDFCANMDKQLYRSLAVDAGMSRHTKIDDLLDNSNFFFLLNETNKNFVMPSNCWYDIYLSGKPFYILPFTPVHAIGLGEPDNMDRLRIRNGNILTISEEEYIYQFNKYALYGMLRNNKGDCDNNTFLVSKTDYELQELLKIAKTLNLEKATT